MNGDKTDLNKGESCFFDALHNNRTDPPRSHKVELSKFLKKLALMPSRQQDDGEKIEGWIKNRTCGSGGL